MNYSFFISKPTIRPLNWLMSELTVEAEAFSLDAAPVMVFTTERILSASNMKLMLLPKITTFALIFAPNKLPLMVTVLASASNS